MFDRDFDYDYFGYKTLERSYLLRVDGKIVERPQHLLMRVSIGIHKDVEKAIDTYHMLSERWMTHASPTLFNSGTPRPQLSSCFLIAMKEDSIEGIYDTLKECACISKSAGGIGLSIHDIRATSSYIRGTNGTSNGIIPMLRVFNDTARYVDQGGGKRKGAFAIYLEPWHADIFDWLDLRKNHGKEEARARDLFYGLWTNDLFMKRVEANGEWTLFCPNESPGLADCWGEEFEALYAKYESEGKGKKTIKAQQLWFAILESQVETGNPYMLFKDACNRKSNQQNLGTIRSSNLCTEIVEFTSPEETAVCNLASIALPRFVVENNPSSPTGRTNTLQKKLRGSLNAANRYFDHAKLAEITRKVTRNLNRIIDVNFYPVETAKRSNMKHRPIGLGVQGLADVFILLGLPFDSPEAKSLNAEIFETIYFAALTESNDIAERDGTYESYPGSPVSKGILQPDMWGVTEMPGGTRHDWSGLRAKVSLFVSLGDAMKSRQTVTWSSQILKLPITTQLPPIYHTNQPPPPLIQISTHGVRNSLLVAPMPTASTSQILGNNECFEPYTSNIYARRVLSGEFTVVNNHLLSDLTEMGLWDPSLKNELISSNGSRPDPGPPGQPQGDLQDGVGDQAARAGGHGRRPRRVHRPVPVLQRPHVRRQLGETHVASLLRLEKGAQDGHVLPPVPRGCGCRQVHRRPQQRQGQDQGARRGAGVGRELQGEPARAAGKTEAKAKAAAVDPDMEEEALMAAKLACSLANKDECMMCGA